MLLICLKNREPWRRFQRLRPNGIIAKKLSCSADMILVKRLRSPYHEEMAIGAVTPDGTTYPNKSLIDELEIPEEYINNELSYQFGEIKHQIDIYCGGRSIFCMRKTLLLLVKQS